MKSRRKNVGADRDGTTFLSLPTVLIDSDGYRALSHTARSLLVDVGRQYNRTNNGKLVITARWYKPMGWTSADVVSRAKNELLQAGILFETRRGARPNRASWYALTFFGLDVESGLDVSPSQFKRGAYIRPDPALAAKRDAARRTRRQPIKALSPSHGTARKAIAPSHGTETRTPVPSGGAMRPPLPSPPIPCYGNYLELPSEGTDDEGTKPRAASPVNAS